MTTYSYVGEVLYMDGEAVLLVEGATPEQMAALVLDYQASADAPKIDPLLARARHVAKQDIEGARDTTLDNGVTWNGKRWYADQVFQNQITSYIVGFLCGVLQPGATVPVRAMDKTVNQLTFDDLKALSPVLMAHVQQAYGGSWVEKSTVEALGPDALVDLGYGPSATKRALKGNG
jgi:hypothetical protein